MRIELNMSLRGFVIAQFAIVTGIVLLGLAYYLDASLTGEQRFFGFLRVFDVGSEQSIPTYVSTLNLVLSAALLFVIYRYEEANDNRGFHYWLFLSILFLVLSIDESASIHEKFAKVHDSLADNGMITPVLETHQWLPFGVLFVLIVGCGLFPFYRTLPRATVAYFFAAGAIFLIGALGFEFAGALMLKSGFVESKKDIVYLIRRVFEEGFEMYGIALFNCVLYREIMNRKVSLTIAPA